MAGAPPSAGPVYQTNTSSHGCAISPTQCLFNLESCWMIKDMPGVHRALDQVLYTIDPRAVHSFILETLEGSHDMRRKKPDSMAVVVLKQFEHWCNTHPHILTPEVLSVALTEELKHEAFRISNNAHANVFDHLCRIYHLDRSGNEFLVPHIRELLSKHQYKEATQCASKLNLHQWFTLEEMCLPLLLQDKTNIVENYVKNNESMQIALVQSLDQYCYKGFDAGQFLSELQIPGARKDKLRPQNLSKLIMRLVKMFKLNPAEVAPNTCHTKDYGAMKYLLYKKYVEMSYGTTVPSQQKQENNNWDELLENTIRNNVELQEELITQLVCYNDVTAAAEWSQRFNIPPERLHPSVVAEIARLEEEYSRKPPPDDNDDWEDDMFTEAEMTYPPDTCHRLALPMSHVIVVSSIEALEQCQANIIKHGVTVGIDMEWRPTFTPTQITRVALVQLATYENVYLLDMIALHDASQPDKVRSFFTALLCGRDVLKLGFGIKTDLQMLHKSYPYLREAVSQIRRMVDLHTLSRQIVYALPDIMGEKAPASEAESVAAEKGLRELVKQCLGKPLDKKEQLSDWERRPLRLSQMHYAALDAYCLLEVYDLLKSRVKAAELEINMEPPLSSKPPAISNQPKNSRSANRKAEREKKKQNNSGASSDSQHSKVPNCPPLKPSEVSVICDNMLQGLGRYLRACGIDVKILSNDDDHDVAAKIAREDGRYILTSGSPYQTLKSYVGEGRCLNVSSMGKARDQAIEVIERLNIQVTPQDIFSRCQVCNGDLYIKVPSSDMHQMWIRKQHLLRQGKTILPGWSTTKHDSTDTGGAFTFKETQAALDDITHQPGTSGAYANSGPSAQTVPPPGGSKWKGTSYDDDDYDDGFDDLEVYYDGDFNEEPDSPPLTISHQTGHNTSSQSWGTWDPNPPPKPPPGFQAKPAAAQATPLSSMYGPNTTSSIDGIDYQRQIVGENGVPIQVEALAEGIFTNVEVFFVCATCGKVFWEGKHFERILAQFESILVDGVDRQGRHHVLHS